MSDASDLHHREVHLVFSQQYTQSFISSLINEEEVLKIAATILLKDYILS